MRRLIGCLAVLSGIAALAIVATIVYLGYFYESPTGTTKTGEVVTLNGVIALHGDLATDTEFGASCQGAGSYDFVAAGAPVNVQPEGQRSLGHYTLIVGKGTGDGACELPFTGNIHFADMYRVWFDPKDGSTVPPILKQCSSSDTYEAPGMVFLHLHVWPDRTSAECVRPDLD